MSLYHEGSPRESGSAQPSHELPHQVVLTLNDPIPKAREGLLALNEAVLERMLHGLSTRDHVHGIEACGQEESTTGISKSTVSRRFVQPHRVPLA